MGAKHKHSRLKLLKMLKRTLESIEMTPKTDVKAFIRLKKQAQKYLRQAQETPAETKN